MQSLSLTQWTMNATSGKPTRTSLNCELTGKLTFHLQGAEICNCAQFCAPVPCCLSLAHTWMEKGIPYSGLQLALLRSDQVSP